MTDSTFEGGSVCVIQGCKKAAAYWIGVRTNTVCEHHFGHAKDRLDRERAERGARKPSRVQRRAALRRLHARGPLW